MKKQSTIVAAVFSSLFAASAFAQEVSASGGAAEKDQGPGDRGAFVVGGKVGLLASFSGLEPNVVGALEVGYVFPWLDRSFALYVDGGYAAPVTTGEASDKRVAGGKYSWHIVEKQLTIAPSVYYRYTGLGMFVPYAGVGPRIMLQESVIDSDDAEPIILETTEHATKVGLGVHGGVDILLGPGAVVGEVLFQAGGLDHTSTGDVANTALTVWVGYRFML